MNISYCTEDEPLVSVISLVYNHAEYLEDNVKSLVEQDTDFPYEIVYHDDLSTDNSLSILKEFQRKYPSRITILEETDNQYSKLKGRLLPDLVMPTVRGKYIAFCEGDDYWCSNKKLQKQVNFLENHPEYSGTAHTVTVVDNQKKPTGELIFDTKAAFDITDLDEYLSFPQTSSFVMRNPWHANTSQPKLLENMAGWDKSFAMYMVVSGKVRVFPDRMSCYRHVQSHGTSSEAREAIFNLTRDKIEAEYDLYNQLRSYEMLGHDQLFYAPHYCNNVVMYSIKKVIKKPTMENIKLFLMGIDRCPYPKVIAVKYLMSRAMKKIQGGSNEK